MTGRGHFATGVAFAIPTFIIANHFGGNGLLALIMCISGSTAPDWLEIRRGENTIIPHRTITHFLPLWVFTLFWSLFSISPDTLPFLEGIKFFDDFILDNIYASLLFGFSIGALLHLLFDLPNPMGIPLLLPWKRFSLNLWYSGEKEKSIIVFVTIFSILFVGEYYFGFANWLLKYIQIQLS